MDFDIGSTGVAKLHYSFAPAKEFDIEAERKRILQHNGHFGTPYYLGSAWRKSGEER